MGLLKIPCHPGCAIPELLGLGAAMVRLKFAKKSETGVVSLDFQNLKRYDSYRLAFTKVEVSL